MKHTAATKARLSKMRVGKRNPFYGRKHSPETIEKIRAANVARTGQRARVPAPQTVVIPGGVALGYLVGLIDGEGSVGVRSRGSSFVTIYNTDAALMDWLVTNVGGSVGGSPDRRGRELCYAWTVQRARDVHALCLAVEPFIIAKYEDVQKTRKYLEVTYGL